MFQLWERPSACSDGNRRLTIATTTEQQLQAQEDVTRQHFIPISEVITPVPYVVSGATLVVKDTSGKSKERKYDYNPDSPLILHVPRTTEVQIGYQDGHETDETDCTELAKISLKNKPHSASTISNEPSRAPSVLSVTSEAPTNSNSRGSSAQSRNLTQHAQKKALKKGEDVVFDFGILAPEKESVEVTELRNSIRRLLEFNGLTVYLNDDTTARLGKFRTIDVMENFLKCKNFIVLQGKTEDDCHIQYWEPLMSFANQTKRKCCLIQYDSNPFESFLEYSCNVVEVDQYLQGHRRSYRCLTLEGLEVVRTSIAGIYSYLPTLQAVQSFNCNASSKPRILILGEDSTGLATKFSQCGVKPVCARSLREFTERNPLVADIQMLTWLSTDNYSFTELLSMYALGYHNIQITVISPAEITGMNQETVEYWKTRANESQTEPRGVILEENDPLIQALLDITVAQETWWSRMVTGVKLLLRLQGPVRFPPQSELVTCVMHAFASRREVKGIFQELHSLLQEEDNLPQYRVHEVLWSTPGLSVSPTLKLLPALHTNYGKLLLLTAQIADLSQEGQQQALDSLRSTLTKDPSKHCVNEEGKTLMLNKQSWDSTDRPFLTSFMLEDISIFLKAKTKTPDGKWVPNSLWTLDQMHGHDSEVSLGYTTSERYMLQDMLKVNAATPLFYQQRALALMLTTIDKVCASDISVFHREFLCRASSLRLLQGSSFPSSAKAAEEALFIFLHCNLSPETLSLENIRSMFEARPGQGIVDHVDEKMLNLKEKLHEFIHLEPRLAVLIHKVLHHQKLNNRPWKTRNLRLLLDMMKTLYERS